MRFFKRGPDPRDLVIEHLLKQNADLLDRLQETIGQIHLHQVQRAQIPQGPGPRKLHVSEEEDELNWQHGEGLIDSQELKDALDQLDFDNTEIDIHF